MTPDNNASDDEEIKIETLKVKGDKNSIADSEMVAQWRSDGLLDINKGFMGLIFSSHQAEELGKWLNKMVKRTNVTGQTVKGANHTCLNNQKEVCECGKVKIVQIILDFGGMK